MLSFFDKNVWIAPRSNFVPFALKAREFANGYDMFLQYNTDVTCTYLRIVGLHIHKIHTTLKHAIAPNS